ncbi:MAG: Rne/Rng family ribonuclease, partial [Planctomycetes bacterium]|nr:Rne/Rng family ribonuclease [Planctomycetota bacterium]
AENAGDEQDAEPADAAEDEPAAEGDEDPAEGGGLRKRRRRRGGRGRKKETQQSAAPAGAKRRQLMVVNDVPGEECRIAILEEGRLEQIFAERESTATNVGNIYKGRVMNVEPAIQAAFVDFGEGQNGFLHISDLHPQYFPGQERTERVGKKIARRDRPPIQDALKRGQEIVVQVLKEGIGTKGPTLTSYISIPGRLLVMMPQMDKVGVSRKVDDEDQRREMRRILDSLELPDGFGFILRTAGMDRTKTELQRDAAYLQKIWGFMARRAESTGAPCELYTEGNLLLRTIRDVADDTVDAIVVDSPSAFESARMFLDIVAPLNAPRLLFWDRSVPVFEAFGIERQIEQIHAREVPLPSGGALVIDQTEAMVAIDVNSGRSRGARDSETNAFNTNKEAVDEIARQLRLRDLGGIIVNDLIDMRSSKHRREIESRLDSNLSRDRAKTTTLEISDFGIVEMTRQRMRPGLHKAEYVDCPHCQGSGEVRVPEAVAGDMLRKVALLFSYERIARVEIVCSTRVAGVFLSTRRHALHELEERSGKKVELRISEAFAAGRVDLYAYDDRGSDIELDRLPRIPAPRLDDLPTDVVDREEDDDRDDGPEAGDGRRRRKRRRKPAPADATAIALAGGFDDLPTPSADEPSVSEMIRRADAERDQRKRDEDDRKRQEAQQRREDEKRRREEAAAEREAARAARAAERAARIAAGEDVPEEPEDANEDGADGDSASGDGTGAGGTRKRRRRRRRRGKGGDRGDRGEAQSSGGDADAGDGAEGGSDEGDGDDTGSGGDGPGTDGTGGEGDGKRKRRRRRGGRGRKRGRDGDGASGSEPGASGGEGAARSDGGGNGAGGSGGESRGESHREPRARSERSDAAPASNPSGDPAAGGEASPLDAAKKTIRSVTGWMRRLKAPASGGRDDR